MEKRGLYVVIAVIVLALVIAIFGTNIFNQSTGKATLTSGASYGPISNDFNRYSNCVYITEDDEWSVTKKGVVQFYDTEEKTTSSISDICTDKNHLTEYDCDGKYRVRRAAVCPSDMECKDGACVSLG